MLLLLLCIFIVITFVQPQLMETPLKGLPLVYYVMLATGSCWIVRVILSRKANINRDPQNYLMVLLLIVAVVSTFSVGWLFYSYNVFIEQGKILIIYLLIVSLVESKPKLTLVIWVILLSMLITAYIGILQSFGIDLTGLGMQADGRIRGPGIFDTNQLAYGLTFCVPLLWSLFILHKNVVVRLALAGILCVYLWSLYLTQSRGGVLALSVVILLIMISSSRSKITKFFAGFLTFSMVSFFAYFMPRFSTTANYRSDESSLGRINIWGEALSVSKSNLLFGFGKDRFIELLGMASHNSYVQVLTEMGFVGLFVWLALFYSSLKGLYFIKNNTKDLFVANQARMFSVLLVAYLIASFFSSSAYYVILTVFFALVTVTQNLDKSLSGLKKLFGPKDVFNVLVLEIVTVVFIHLLVKFSG